MYRILTFLNYSWSECGAERPDDLEATLRFVKANIAEPWRIQEWIDIRNGPAEAGFWRDIRYWIDGQP